MKIVILNGSPHLNGPTSDMVDGFIEGVTSVGHEVEHFHVAHMNIHGSIACEYCRNKKKGKCANDRITTGRPHLDRFIGISQSDIERVLYKYDSDER